MATKATIKQYEADYGRRPYFKSLLLAFDQFLNAFLGGYVDETLSSRAYPKQCCRYQPDNEHAEKAP